MFVTFIEIFHTFGKNTNSTVVDVDSCVLMNPSRYLMSGPARGRINKLKNSNMLVKFISIKVCLLNKGLQCLSLLFMNSFEVITQPH